VSGTLILSEPAGSEDAIMVTGSGSCSPLTTVYPAREGLRSPVMALSAALLIKDA
jgi:hypothetical protein